MPHLEGTFPIARRKALFYQAWLPEERPKGVIVLVHGLADHSGRYSNVVNYLLPKGFALWSYDQRGHGKSPGARCYFNRFTDLTSDLDKFVALVKEQNPDLPLFIIGHSVGALESTAFVADHPQSVTGLALSGLTVPKLMLSLAGVLSVLLPRLGVQQLDCGQISRDPAVVDAYIKDPLVFAGKIPARTGAELIATMAAMQAKLPCVRLPVILLHGSADRIARPSGSQLTFDTIASTDKELHLFPGCYHEIFNEPCHEFVLGVLSRWLDKHIPS